jgi:hypothetical protein
MASRHIRCATVIAAAVPPIATICVRPRFTIRLGRSPALLNLGSLFAVRDSASQELRPAPDIQNGVIPYVLGSEFTRYSRCRLLRYRFGGNKCGILHPSNVVSSTVLTLSICTFGKRPIRQRLPLSFTKRPGRGLFVISLTAMKPRRFGKRWFGASITLPRLGIIQNSPGIFE